MSKIAGLIASNLERIRKLKGLSQEDLGGLAGLTRQTIWSYEKALGNINLATIEKIAKGLQIDELELIKVDASSSGGLAPEQIQAIVGAIQSIETLPIPKDILNGISLLNESQRETAWIILRSALAGLMPKTDGKKKSG